MATVSRNLMYGGARLRDRYVTRRFTVAFRPDPRAGAEKWWICEIWLADERIAWDSWLSKYGAALGAFYLARQVLMWPERPAQFGTLIASLDKNKDKTR